MATRHVRWRTAALAGPVAFLVLTAAWAEFHPNWRPVEQGVAERVAQVPPNPAFFGGSPPYTFVLVRYPDGSTESFRCVGRRNIQPLLREGDRVLVEVSDPVLFPSKRRVVASP